MDWSLTDKIMLICMIAFLKYWRIIIPVGIGGLVALGYFWGAG